MIGADNGIACWLQQQLIGADNGFACCQIKVHRHDLSNKLPYWRMRSWELGNSYAWQSNIHCLPCQNSCATAEANQRLSRLSFMQNPHLLVALAMMSFAFDAEQRVIRLCNALQRCAMHCSAVQCNAALGNAMQRNCANGVQCWAMECSTH